MALKAVAKYSPSRIVLISLLSTIILGTVVLSHPACQKTPIAFIDLLFNAASATCVTGLTTIPLEHLSFTGHVALLLMIQIGGLGILTLTLFLIALIIDLGMATQLVAGQLLNRDSWNDAKEILTFIIVSTITMELAGTILLYLTLWNAGSYENPFFLALFHSISAFCDAGMTLINLKNGTAQHRFLLLGITAFLTLTGGLGFITWQEIINRYRHRNEIRKPKLSLQSKIIISSTAIIIGICTILFWTLEKNHSLQDLSTFNSLLSSFFHTISFRSSGFTALSAASFTQPTLLLIMLLAFIGSSPGSTGSGIKITTFVILLAFIRSTLTESPAVEITGRQIPRDLVARALTIIALASGWIIIMTFFLLIAQENASFLNTLFEVLSASTTLGVSTGLTPSLSLPGKIIIIICMIAGRMGPLALALAFCKRPIQKEFSYPEERIMIG